ncbi:MAG: N-6 DNA methylase [Candidatus Thorarchaeota archaeon]
MDTKTRDSRLRKKQLGSFYTPPHLAAKIAEESLNAWLDRHSGTDRAHQLKLVQNLKILDPSVGAGAFLIAAGNWLDKTRQELGEQSTSSKRRESITRNSLYGVDIVPEAIEKCLLKLLQWVFPDENDQLQCIDSLQDNIRHGNSLTTFDWYTDFSSVTSRDNPGFDIILGNPPYGNLLSKAERDFIKSKYPNNVGGNRTGTWNSAAHFIVKASMLLRNGGELGFLIPNSILRVKQFTKTRAFLLENLKLWKIVDEGSPFDGVTLEMVTIFCKGQKPESDGFITVESRRPGFEQNNLVPFRLLKSSGIFPIYHDELFETILKKGQKNLLIATRGRDIPKEHVKHTRVKPHIIPYVTSGRSVRRYHIDEKYQTYTDDWYLRDEGMKESFNNELLVATKNYKHPRCVIKPTGIIHGGGIVHIRPAYDEINLRVLGLILNSRLVRYICNRYLTNYSQLTTCLNTGILEELPIVLPEYPETYSLLFEALSDLHNEKQSPDRDECIKTIENVSEALVYDLYFGKAHSLQKGAAQSLEGIDFHTSLIVLCDRLKRKSLVSEVNKVMDIPQVQEVENQLSEKTIKSPRY